MGTRRTSQDPILLVVDFHHARGPEIELSFCEDGTDPVGQNDWSLLPFMALTDGAHASTEDFSYFTLRCNATTAGAAATSLFGISCTRQLASSSLINRPPEVTRSTVQKAVVVIINEPKHFGQLREKLSIVTSAWFAQRDFSDTDILKKFWESLKDCLNGEAGQNDHHLGLSLREMIHEFKHQTLVLFKCLLLQPKMLFFGSRCERLCMIQFSLISLIPGLLDHLDDCADPAFDTYSQTVEKPTSLKTSERSSLLAYMGLPLQIFGKGSMFGPYTPLQQLDLLADHGTKSYLVGSTNSLLLQQKDRYSDILINLDEDNITISSPSLRLALALTAADRRWIDFLTQIINETWDEAHPDRPKTHGYLGSEEFIRLQFEEYLLALLSSMKYHEQSANQAPSTPSSTTPKSPAFQPQPLDIEGDPAVDFNLDFLQHWQTTSNYSLFSRLTSDSLLFSIVEPRHPCAGGLGFDDIQRRLAQQVSELHLDERVREGREALNRHLATGQKRVTAAFNTFWSDIESMREAQRKKADEKTPQQTTATTTEGNKAADNDPSPRPSFSSVRSPTIGSWGFAPRKPTAADFSQAQASVAAAGQRASAYFSSWGSWATERRKEWQEKRSDPNSRPGSVLSSPTQTPRGSTTLPNGSFIWQADDVITEQQSYDGKNREAPTSLPKEFEEDAEVPKLELKTNILKRQDPPVTSQKAAASSETASSTAVDPKSVPGLPPDATNKSLAPDLSSNTSSSDSQPSEKPRVPQDSEKKENIPPSTLDEDKSRAAIPEASPAAISKQNKVEAGESKD
ncbi:hypothetical protein LOZ66_003661 [Ophidiomyces ophidiicola]|nr:hypothetical protein LOZ66_003661 [Ophidiomyces ophidiicola]